MTTPNPMLLNGLSTRNQGLSGQLLEIEWVTLFSKDQCHQGQLTSGKSSTICIEMWLDFLQERNLHCVEITPESKSQVIMF